MQHRGVDINFGYGFSFFSCNKNIFSMLFLPAKYPVGSCYQCPKTMSIPMPHGEVGRKVAALMTVQLSQFANTFPMKIFLTQK